MKSQRITVSTKGGLIAAFECARDYYGVTNIILNRLSGKTKIKLRPHLKGYKCHRVLIPKGWDGIIWKRRINKAKAKIRRIPAKELLA